MDRQEALSGGEPSAHNEGFAPALPLRPDPEPYLEAAASVLSAPIDDRADGATNADVGGLETGRALALADFSPPRVNAGEALVRFAYRLGLPQSAINPFRKTARPRLLATVTNPLPGDAAAGTALRAGHFLVHGVKSSIADTEFTGPRQPPPLERLIHGFGWLDDLAACAPRQQVAPVAERILAQWLAVNPQPAAGPAWDLRYVAHRVMAWLIHAPLILSGDKAFRARVLHELSVNARWLDRNVGKGQDKLAEMAGWCAITAAGLLLSEGKPRRLFGEAGLIRVLGDVIGEDGGVLSRSPLCQIEAIELLLRLRACYAALRLDPPQQVDVMLTLLVPPLLSVLHGDGGLGNWQGAGAISAEWIAELIKTTGVRARPLRDARQWGYQRVTGGKNVLIFDAAPPPAARQARDGCASTLAFEFSAGKQRLIVNCGGAAFAGGQIPVRLAQGLRATAAHSTLAIDDFNSTAVLINGRLGSGVGEVLVDRRAVDGGTRVEASHDGYVSRYGLLHRRILILRDDGSELRGEDVLEATGRKGKRGTVGVALRFHLGPGVDVGQSADGLGATLVLPDGGLWQFRSGRDPVSIEESLWSDGQGRPVGIRQLVVNAKISRSGETFSWLLKKIR